MSSPNRTRGSLLQDRGEDRLLHVPHWRTLWARGILRNVVGTEDHGLSVQVMAANPARECGGRDTCLAYSVEVIQPQ